MSGEAQLLLWIAGVHLLGFVCVGMLILAALRDPPDTPGTSDSSSDDGWGNQRPVRPSPWNVPGGGLPLPDALQSAVRLRGPGRLSDLLPKPDRRPAREPERTPVRADN
jgi:hypothetical protein